MREIANKLRGWKDRAVKFWGSLRPKQKTAVATAGGILGISFLVGGVFLQAAVGAAVTVGCLGWALHESELAKKIMLKWGRGIDITLTVIGILAGPGGGITAILFGCMLGGFFTVLRTLLWGEKDQTETAEPSKEVAHVV